MMCVFISVKVNVMVVVRVIATARATARARARLAFRVRVRRRIVSTSPPMTFPFFFLIDSYLINFFFKNDLGCLIEKFCVFLFNEK